jgi:hypothetical protein
MDIGILKHINTGDLCIAYEESGTAHNLAFSAMLAEEY